jgi:tight adherence protein C
VGTTASYALSRNSAGSRRLRELTQPDADALVPSTLSLTQSVTPAVQRLATFIPKSPKELGRLRKRLTRAGYHGLTAAAVYRASELFAPLVCAAVVLIVVPFPKSIIPAALVGMVGYVLPGFVLQRLTSRRQMVIQNGLPDALDLLIVCLEAGCALDQAMLKASEELAIPYPALAEELRLLIVEIRAGKPRLEAFKNLSDRTGVDDVRALVSMLVQTDRFGTSVAQALRVHAVTARTKRRQRAEEKAAKVGVKLVFPLVMCLFPAFFVVTLGPAVIQFVRVFFGQLVNHM